MKKPPSKAIRLIPRTNYAGLVIGIGKLLEAARHVTAQVSSTFITATYWEVRRRIVKFEEGGRSRAEFGAVVPPAISGISAGTNLPDTVWQICRTRGRYTLDNLAQQSDGPRIEAQPPRNQTPRSRTQPHMAKAGAGGEERVNFILEVRDNRAV